MRRRSWGSVLAFALLVAGIVGCAAAGPNGAASAPPYFPLTHDPNLIEPPWHRYILAFQLIQKCGFADDQAKLKLAIAAARGKALTPPTPQDSAPDPDVTAINNTPAARLCNSAMKSFVEAQAAAAP